MMIEIRKVYRHPHEINICVYHFQRWILPSNSLEQCTGGMSVRRALPTLCTPGRILNRIYRVGRPFLVGISPHPVTS